MMMTYLHHKDERFFNLTLSNTRTTYYLGSFQASLSFLGRHQFFSLTNHHVSSPLLYPLIRLVRYYRTLNLPVLQHFGKTSL